MNAAKVRAAMEARGWTPADLAELTKLSPPTIASVLSGRRRVYVSTAKSVAKAFRENPTVLDGWLEAS